MVLSQLGGAAAPNTSPDNGAGKLDFSGPNRGSEQSLVGQKNPARTPEPGASVTEKRQTALQVVERHLTLGYQKLSTSYQRASSPAAFEPLSAEKVASNILGFIEHRLRQDAAEGATQEELQSRLDAGLSGFKKGFAEAKEKLGALSMLSPEVRQDIGKTKTLVLGGIEDLRERVLSGHLESKPRSSQASEAGRPEQNSWGPSSGRYEYARASEFRFSLLTAEGDRVTINAQESTARASGFENRASGFDMTASKSSAQSFSISVDGELSEEEQGAIAELLGKVDKLATQFFAGDLDQAFTQAQKLGYDSEQIAAFSLNLSQVEVRRASQTYGQIAHPDQDKGAAGLQASLEPLAEFLQTLKSALATASKLVEQPERLVADLSAELVRSEPAADFEPGQRFQTFVEQLLAASR